MIRPALEFVVVTIFPGIFPGPVGVGVVGKAFERGDVALSVRDLREHAVNRYGQVDDATFGGGPGMVMRPEPLFDMVDAIRAEAPAARTRVVLLDPGGRRFDQAVAREYAGLDRLVLVCGRYEGVDDRVRRYLVDEELSVGDYVVSGGEIPALAVIDAVARLVPGVVGRAESVERESFVGHRLDYPHYTRPADFRGMVVPDVLLSGHHAEIEAWRRREAEDRTRRCRPDLLDTETAARPGTGECEA